MSNRTKIFSRPKTITTSSAFLPTSITGCGLWLDGADPAGTGVQPAVNSTVSTWKDKSGTVNDGTSGSATFNTDSVGAYINFTGSQTYVITNPNIVVNQYFTVFVVETLQNYPGTDTAFMGGTGQNNNNLHLLYRGNEISFSFYGADMGATPSFVFSNNASQPTRIWTFSFIANLRNIYLNGTSIGSSANDTKLSGWGGARIGFYYDSGRNYRGKMREILIYSGTINTTNRQTIESYLANKWGLTASLPAGHPGLTSVPSISVTTLAPTTAVVSATFIPTSISGCGIWLDSTDITSFTYSSASNISQWRDKSGFSNHFNTSSGTPTSILDNSRSVVNFPSGAIMSSASQITFTTSSAFFLVSKTTGVASWGVNIVGFTNNGSLSIRLYEYILGGTQSTVVGDINDLANDNYYVNGSFNPSFGSNVYFNVYSIIGTVSPITNGTTYVTLSSSDYGRYFIGNIAEFIYYPAGLTSNQRQTVEGYLAQKWGLTASMPAGHPALTSILYGTTTITLPKQKVASLPKFITTTSSFLPTSITGCQLWLDGADTSSMTLSSGTVSQWNDKSGKGFNATTPAGANSPPYNASTRELQFVDSNSHTLRIAQGFGDALVGTTFSIFFVARRTTGSGYHYILGNPYEPKTSRTILMIGFFNNNMQTNTYSPEFNSSISTYSSPDPVRLYCFEVKSSSLATHILNGTQIGSDTSNYTLTSFTNPELGRRYGNTYHTFNLSEIIAFSPALTTNQRQQVESYLAQKWGLTASLPVGHPALTTSLYGSVTIIAPTTITTTFLPTSIAGCHLWLDAADTSTISPSTGGTLTAWTDKSGTNKTIVVNSGPTYVTTGFNGSYPYMNFTAGNYLTLTVPSIGTGDIAIFAVWRQTTSTQQHNVFSIGVPAGGTETAVGWNNGENRYKFYRYAGPQSVNSSSTNNANVIGSAIQVSGVKSLFINGNTPDSTGTESYNQTNTTAYIGNSSSFRLFGELAELIFYIGTLTTTQRQTIESYLAQKWGLTASLPAGHPGLTTSVYQVTVTLPRQKIRLIPPTVPLVSYTQTFSYTGTNQTFVVPATTTSITVYMWGAGGAGNTNYGGAAAMVQGVFTTTPGETLNILVGQGGTINGSTTYGGGGAGGGNMTSSAAGIGYSGNGFPENGGSGGGRSAIQRGGTDPTNDIVVAGGGGGGSYFSSDYGGSATFSGTANPGAGGLPGLGGTQSAGGAGGGTGQYGQGLGGSRGIGGNTYNNNIYNGGGGGGGGYYGGGAGGTNGGDGAGGGGGSSLTSALSLISGQSVLGFNSTNGYTAPNNTSPYYVSGVGNGAPSISSNPRAGDNGRVVLVYMA